MGSQGFTHSVAAESCTLSPLLQAPGSMNHPLRLPAAATNELTLSAATNNDGSGMRVFSDVAGFHSAVATNKLITLACVAVIYIGGRACCHAYCRQQGSNLPCVHLICCCLSRVATTFPACWGTAPLQRYDSDRSWLCTCLQLQPLSQEHRGNGAARYPGLNFREHS